MLKKCRNRKIILDKTLFFKYDIQADFVADRISCIGEVAELAEGARLEIV